MALRALALVLLALAVAVGGCGSDTSSPPPPAAHTVAQDTDGDGVADARDADPNVASIRTRADKQRALEQTRRSQRQRERERRATRDSDPAAEANSFYLRMDDAAVALDDAIGDALHDDAAAARRIRSLRATIRERNNRWLLSGHDSSVGANLLQSAATAAAEASSPRALVNARVEAQRARDKLAREAVAP